MYAIVEIGGKHYHMEKGAELDIDLLQSKAGDKVKFDTVTLYRTDKDALVGTPYVKNVAVSAEVIEPLVKGDKLTVFKFRHKTNYRVKTGHRQKYTRIVVKDIKKATSKAAPKEPVTAE